MSTQIGLAIQELAGRAEKEKIFIRNTCIDPIQNRQLPVHCINEACNEPLCVRDLLHFTASLKHGLRALTQASLGQFIQRGDGQYRFCSRRNCEGVAFWVNCNSELVCDLCLFRMCTECLNYYHYPISCEQAKSDRGFEEWMKGDANRRKCPKCGMAIEKLDGCNRVTCTNCERSICWNCMQPFATSSVC